MMDAVHRFEGTVNQVLGDGIMALFGAPIAHEDHALRACYAALAMQTAMQPFTEEVRRTRGLNRACAWASTPGKWWCGRLATTCIWTTRRWGRRPIGRPHGAVGDAGEHSADRQHPRARGRAGHGPGAHPHQGPG